MCSYFLSTLFTVLFTKEHFFCINMSLKQQCDMYGFKKVIEIIVGNIIMEQLSNDTFIKLGSRRAGEGPVRSAGIPIFENFFSPPENRFFVVVEENIF